eukprot:760184-Hanusia_phi.AAC.6
MKADEDDNKKRGEEGRGGGGASVEISSTPLNACPVEEMLALQFYDVVFQREVLQAHNAIRRVHFQRLDQPQVR